MRKVTEIMVEAFKNGVDCKMGNTEVYNNALYLFGNRIAWYENDGMYIQAVFDSFSRISNTTKERLNGIKDVNIYTQNKVTYLNGKPWDGKAIRVVKFKNR